MRQRAAITRLDAAVGVRIEGVDPAQPLADDAFDEVRRAVIEHGVAIIHRPGLTPAAQVGFSRHFGELERNVFVQYTLRSDPEVFVVSNIVENGHPIGLRDGGSVWHTDMSYAARPASMTLLYGRVIPKRDGQPLGDTLFAGTADAFDALPAAMQQRLMPLRAVHRLSARYDGLKKGGKAKPGEVDANHRDIPDAVHPIVRRHPVSGRLGLYLNPGLTVGIVGMPADEAAELIDELVERCTQPAFTYRHRWQDGDLVIWDNRCLLHRATMDYNDDEPRLMHRTTAIGEVPLPALH